ATANPYLALAAIVRAGLEGIRSQLQPPPVFDGDPGMMSAAELAELGLVRLPETLEAALLALEADQDAYGWLSPNALETYLVVKRTEIAHLQALDPNAICELY